MGAKKRPAESEERNTFIASAMSKALKSNKKYKDKAKEKSNSENNLEHILTFKPLDCS